MPYSYYCTHCGRKLDQNKVLLDLYPIITGDTKTKLELLRFRLTMAEFLALYQSGSEVSGGFRRCQLTLEQLMGYIANKNNLDDPAIATLTLRELKEYLGDTDLTGNAALVTPQKKEKSHEELLFARLEDDEDEDDPFFSGQTEAAAPTGAVKLAEPQIPAAIGAILSVGNQSVDDIIFAKERLRKDLESLYNLFRIRDEISFMLHLCEEEDDKGQKLLTAYRLRKGTDECMVEQARVCPACATPVFDHAGTARHQSVAFIGYRESGKTSTILSLTHYTIYAIMGALKNKIWAGTPGIDTVSQVEVVGRSRSLMNDLLLYHDGIAPQRTSAEVRDNAYSATLRIRNNSGKHHLLTLVDLPGELCKVPNLDKGELKPRIDTDKILKEFQIALSADAYVVCFDAAAIQTSEGIMADIQNVCTWADQFQQLRADYIGDDSFSVPMMVLFTKCEDLEGSAPILKPNGREYVQPVDKVYMFSDEKQIIRQNPIYNRVMEQFGTFGRLNRAYHAVLRSSPFGYKAPSETDLARDPTAVKQIPSPRNMDKLMRWLLAASGCIPAEAEYRKYEDNSTPFIPTENYCITPPQNRIKPPKDDNEALSRCALFENSGLHDRTQVMRLGDSTIERLGHRFLDQCRKIIGRSKENTHG